MAGKFPTSLAIAPVPYGPLEMLSACHERILRQCRTLQRLAKHYAVHGSDEAAQTAAASVLRYFQTAAIDHHHDEEDDLFPALIDSMAGSDAHCLHALVEGLATEHRQLEAYWAELSPALHAIASGAPASLETSSLDAFCAAYAAHIQREEDELLPMAARLLSDEAIAHIGQAMRGRRGGDAG